MEASALSAPAAIARSGRFGGVRTLLKLRSDEQLVALFRAGNDEAFQVIHDRYRQRLLAYTRQMLAGAGHDAEDALQDVFIRAYSGLRSDDREMALRPWLYRVAHNRCIDQLRRPVNAGGELIEMVRAEVQDPVAQAEQREALRRLITDVQRLPQQQRSALLLRELIGMSYAELSSVLGVSIPGIKSLLVRARVGLIQAATARDTACGEIREGLIHAHDRGVRPTAMVRRHLRDCAPCRQFRSEVRGVSRQLSALVPAVGPATAIAKLLGLGSGGGMSGGGVAGGSIAGGGAALAGGAASGGGLLAASGLLAGGATHAAALLAATVVTAGGALEVQHTIAPARAAVQQAAPASVPVVSAALPAVTAALVSRAVSAPAAPPPPAPPAPAAAAPRPAFSGPPAAQAERAPVIPSVGSNPPADLSGAPSGSAATNAGPGAAGSSATTPGGSGVPTGSGDSVATRTSSGSPGGGSGDPTSAGSTQTGADGSSGSNSASQAGSTSGVGSGGDRTPGGALSSGSSR